MSSFIVSNPLMDVVVAHIMANGRFFIGLETGEGGMPTRTVEAYAKPIGDALYAVNKQAIVQRYGSADAEQLRVIADYKPNLNSLDIATHAMRAAGSVSLAHWLALKAMHVLQYQLQQGGEIMLTPEYLALDERVNALSNYMLRNLPQYAAVKDL